MLFLLLLLVLLLVVVVVKLTRGQTLGWRYSLHGLRAVTTPASVVGVDTAAAAPSPMQAGKRAVRTTEDGSGAGSQSSEEEKKKKTEEKKQWARAGQLLQQKVTDASTCVWRTMVLPDRRSCANDPTPHARCQIKHACPARATPPPPPPHPHLTTTTTLSPSPALPPAPQGNRARVCLGLCGLSHTLAFGSHGLQAPVLIGWGRR